MTSHVDVTCTALQSSQTCLTREVIGGLTMQFAASLLSLGCILFTLVFILQNAIRHGSLTGIRIFHCPMDILIFSLLCADCVQAVGGLLSMKWVQDGIAQVGPACDAQGLLKIFGETGVAFSSLLVAVYTFLGVITGRVLKSMRITSAVVCLTWMIIAVLVGIGYATNNYPSKPRFISPAPYWCWVSREYPLWRILIEFLWLWIALFGSLLLYIPLFLWMRGNLVFKEDAWYCWSFQWRSTDSDLPTSRRNALVMLAYPLVYCFCVLPLSFVRWITPVEEARDGSSVISAAFFAITVFHLSGFFNVILVFTTKPKLGLFGRQELGPLRPPSTHELVA